MSILLYSRSRKPSISLVALCCTFSILVSMIRPYMFLQKYCPDFPENLVEFCCVKARVGVYYN